jgi:threonine dehydratase
MLTYPDIEAARRRLAGAAIRTPVLTSRQFDEDAGAKVFFKAENLQRAALVPPFDDELIMAGQATATAELLEDVPDLEVLVVPVSGGGLMAGSAVAAKHVSPSIELYGVEPETGSDTAQSLAKGERVAIEIPKTIADGLQVAQPGELTFPILQKTLAGVLLVSDDEMIETLTWMLERMKVLVEPSGVAGAAAVRHKKADFTGRKVGVILSGGNVDRGKLADYLRASAAPR